MFPPPPHRHYRPSLPLSRCRHHRHHRRTVVVGVAFAVRPCRCCLVVIVVVNVGVASSVSVASSPGRGRVVARSGASSLSRGCIIARMGLRCRQVGYALLPGWVRIVARSGTHCRQVGYASSLLRRSRYRHRRHCCLRPRCSRVRLAYMGKRAFSSVRSGTSTALA